MAGLMDRVVGLFFVIVSLVVFTYYTTWALILPFLSKNHRLHDFFLPHVYAIYSPILLLIVGVTGVSWFLYKLKQKAADYKRK